MSLPTPVTPQNSVARPAEASPSVDSFHVKHASHQGTSTANVQGVWLPYTWLTLQRARCLGCGRSFLLSPSWDAATCPDCHEIFLGKMGSAQR